MNGETPTQFTLWRFSGKVAIVLAEFQESELMAQSQKREPESVEAVLARIRKEVEAEAPKSKVAFYSGPKHTASGENDVLLYSDKLNFLNANWHNWSEPTEYASHRPLVGRVIVSIKQRVQAFIWQKFFSSYFEREREFMTELVRHLNDTARYIDKRQEEIFWEVMKKVDNEVKGVNERTDRLHQEVLLAVRKWMDTNHNSPTKE